MTTKKRHKPKCRQRGVLPRCLRHFSKPGCIIPLILALAVYVYLCWVFIVAPYNIRWRARYGQIDVPPGYSIHGIDISHHQGTINWEELSQASLGEAPITFIMIKGTEGTSHTDSRFSQNFSQAGKGHYVRGVYHFLTPRAGSGRAQARFYLSKVKLKDGDLPPILDIERTGKLTKEQLRHEALQWLNECEKAYGRAPIIYTYRKFKEKYLDGPEFERYPYWIAHYYLSSLDYSGPWKFWQHNDCGQIPGIKGDVDLDIYNGSMYDLRKLCIEK